METAADMIKRDIIPFLFPGGEYFRQIFAAYSDPDYQELSRRLVISKDWDDYFDMMYKVTSTGLFARIGTYPGHPITIVRDPTLTEFTQISCWVIAVILCCGCGSFLVWKS